MAQIDETDQIYDQFARGVHAVFARWTTLRMAVEMGWGGISGRDKAEKLVEEVVAFFEPGGKEVSTEDIASFLDDALLKRFNTDAGDEPSIDAVSNRVLDLFEQCLDGNFKGVEEEEEKMKTEGHQAFEKPRTMTDGSSSSEGEGGAEPMADDGWTVVGKGKK